MTFSIFNRRTKWLDTSYQNAIYKYITLQLVGPYSLVIIIIFTKEVSINQLAFLDISEPLHLYII